MVHPMLLLLPNSSFRTRLQEIVMAVVVMAVKVATITVDMIEEAMEDILDTAPKLVQVQVMIIHSTMAITTLRLLGKQVKLARTPQQHTLDIIKDINIPMVAILNIHLRLGLKTQPQTQEMIYQNQRTVPLANAVLKVARVMGRLMTKLLLLLLTMLNTMASPVSRKIINTINNITSSITRNTLVTIRPPLPPLLKLPLPLLSLCPSPKLLLEQRSKNER